MSDVDIAMLLLGEHARILGALDRLTEADPDARAGAFEDLVHQVAVHEVLEAAVVHHALARRVPGARAAVDRAVAQEAAIEDLIAFTCDLDPRSPEFAMACGPLDGRVRSHLRHEEREELPSLRAGLSRDERHALGRRHTRLRAALSCHGARGPGSLVGSPVSAYDRARAFVATGGPPAERDLGPSHPLADVHAWADEGLARRRPA